MMFEIIRSVFGLPAGSQGRFNGSDQQCDPLSHPALRHLTPDQLADLPIDHTRFAANRNGPCGTGERFSA